MSKPLTVGDTIHAVLDSDISVCSAAIVQRIYLESDDGNLPPDSVYGYCFSAEDGVDSWTLYRSETYTPQTWHHKEECTR